MSEHTPTPWNSDAKPNKCECCMYHVCGDGDLVADVCGSANAAFIVRAVNNFEPLLSAARAVLKILERGPRFDALETAIREAMK